MNNFVYSPDMECLRDGVGRTPWAIYCAEHKFVYLSRKEYTEQMSVPNTLWKCPVCGSPASWNDANYEEFLERLEAYTEEQHA